MSETFEPYFLSEDEFVEGLRHFLSEGYCNIISSLYYLDRPLGYVCFHFKERLFSDYYRIPQIVNFLNNSLGGMINLRHTRYLMRQIDEMYRNDPLTGLYNRRGFCIEYEKLLEQDPGSSLSVVMSDLNGLMTINDTFGHEAGDMAIQTAAQALRYAAGAGSLCMRMGGDEMMAVYVYTQGSDERFRKAFEDYLNSVNSTSGKEYTVAASVGIYHTSPGEKISFCYG